MKLYISILIAILLPGVLLAEAGRYVKQHKLSDGQVAVVAEGDMEPRSIGSYSVRIYRGGNTRFPTDDFLGGLIRKRNGSIERVEMCDIDGDKVPELIIVIRCAGSGSYLSADAISIKDDKPILLISVANLGKNADVLKALRNKQKAKTEQDKSGVRGKPIH